MTVDRTPLVLVCGPRGPLEAVTTSLAEPGAAVVHHDLSGVEAGVVTRRTTRVDADGQARVRDVALGVAGCCVDCMLRMDLLPLLRTLADDAAVRRIVVRLDPLLEAEALCWAIENTVVTGMVGRVDAPAGHDVRIEAVVGCVDAASFLGDATGDEPMSAYDDRTVAQVTVGNARHADVLVVADTAPDRWTAARLTAVLARLAPRAATTWIAVNETPADLLAAVPASSRRGAVDDAHAPLLDGAPPLTEDCGVQLLEISDRRPFHPGRLHEAVDVLLDDVVHARGRLWVATQPDAVLWLESAGGGLRIAAAGRWLAAMDAPRVRRRVRRPTGDGGAGVGRRVRRPRPVARRAARRRRPRARASRPHRRAAHGRRTGRSGELDHLGGPVRSVPRGPVRDRRAPREHHRIHPPAQHRKGTRMKNGIHPDYHPVVFQDSGTGSMFLTRSTVTSDRTVEYTDGRTYPLVVVDVTNESHPFWTGAARVMDTQGRVEKFERRYGKRR